MTDYFKAHAKPTVKGGASPYDSNLIQSSGILLDLYMNLQQIVNALSTSLEKR